MTSKVVRLAIVPLLLLLGVFPVFAGPKHAIARIVHAIPALPTGGYIGLKGVAYGVLFTAETGVDVLHVVTSALDVAASKELKRNPFHYIDAAVARVDVGIESAELL